MLYLTQNKAFPNRYFRSSAVFRLRVMRHTEQSLSQSLFLIVNCFFGLMLCLTQNKVFLNRYDRSSTVSSVSCYASHGTQFFSIVILDHQLFLRPHVVPLTEPSLSQSLF